MPVYLVTLLAPNGNKVERPIVALHAVEAMDIMQAEHDIPVGGVAPCEAVPMPDPDGEIEASLSRMNRRNEERERWG